MRNRFLDTLVIDLVAMGALAAILLDMPAVLRVVLGIPLVLVLPGYALTAAVFSGKVISRSERVAFTLGGSLILVVLGGLLLNLTPQGLQPKTWAALLAATTLLMSLIALLRRTKLEVDTPDTVVVSPNLSSRPFNLGLSLTQGLLLVLAALTVAGAVGVARAGVIQQPRPTFTQLWLLPAPEQGSDAVRLGVRNLEGKTENYNVQLKVGGAPVQTWNSVAVQSGNEWEVVVVLADKLSAKTVEADLFRSSAPGSLYRHVRLGGSTQEK